MIQMRRLLHIVAVLAGLVAIAVGEGCTPRYDGRLMAADSLMRDNPDSALAIVSDVDRAALATEGDRAYGDLLLTQARYRCYITATSDSDINRALHYYRHHQGEREKLTRALIYKGAVMEELGHPDSAMHYYMDAEEVADSTDYFNLGYAKMRMGALYCDHYAYDGMGIHKYENALDIFKQSNEIQFQRKCLNNLGCLYRESNPQKAETLLNEALSISQQQHDTAGIIDDLHALSVLYYYQCEYEHARLMILRTREYGLPVDVSFCSSAANVYAMLGMPDSATFFLDRAKQANPVFTDEERGYFLESLSNIAFARNDMERQRYYENQSNKVLDSLQQHSPKVTISNAEIEHNAKIQRDHRKKNKSRDWQIFISAAALIIIAVITLIRYKHRQNDYKQIIKELKMKYQQQLMVLSRLKGNIDKLQINDYHTKEFVNNQLSMLQDITIACYQEPQSALGRKVKKILQYNERNHDEWTALYGYIDARYNQIMTITRQQYPQLNDKDLLLIALTCLDFSYIQMAIILGYTNHTSIAPVKKRLAEKMGIDCSLNEYTASFGHS